MAEGKINQVIGPVVDVEFAPQQLPSIANALTIDREGQTSLVVEVAQHLGDNMVRCVAMETTDGLVRGMKVQRHRRHNYRSGWRRNVGPLVRRFGQVRSTDWAQSTPSRNFRFIVRRRALKNCQPDHRTV